MAYQHLITQRDGAIERLTLNRPDVRNAFNDTMIAELTDWADRTALDPDVRTVVVSGAGPTFCAGADLNWMAKTVEYTEAENVDDARRASVMFASITSLPVPVIGRVHGAALGGGAGLAAVCDIVVCEEHAMFGFTEVKLGIIPAVISPFVLQKIGRSAARELFLTGRRFTAQHALDVGLVHAVVRPEDLDANVDAIVREVLTCGREALAAAKQLIADVWNASSDEEARTLTAEALARRRASAEGQEGLRAFLEKAQAALEQRVIQRLLIANRGEIAVRIARACRELGIETVAVYSDADAHAAHVVVADQAVRIGPAAAADSYLNVGALLGAARTASADAVHPGYGFLSENAGFAAACRDAGLAFVGPPAEAIARMGSKINARRLAESAGVPVVPGQTPGDQSDAGIIGALETVGLPALVKASAGGGGRGMREVRDLGDAASMIQSARREAQAAFGDGTLYVERLIERPHHVEVQIFADAHGGVVHLFERECSVQRRHQKVIEESPSPQLTPALRQRMTDAAVRAARTAGYINAGTFEFLVDLSQGSSDEAPFYFLEMNTRLQVEHPVTEQVAGVDLVRAQLLVASGEALPWTQSSLSQRGHAIEARVYAEDPAQGFIPQAGRLLLYREPIRPGVRIDSGFREGDTIAVNYDALLAKVIATAETRDLAIARLSSALRDFPILGIRTNIPFLVRVLESEAFRAGRVHTGYLDAEGAHLAADPDAAPPDFLRSIVDAAARDVTPSVGGGSARSWDPWQSTRGWSVR